MKIKVDEKNFDKLNEAIKAAEGKARERKIDARDVVWMVNRIEKELRIPKKRMNGIVAVCDYNAQKYPNAYKYTPESTWVWLQRFPSGWFVVDVERRRTGGTEKRFTLNLPEEAKNAIIERCEKF